MAHTYLNKVPARIGKTAKERKDGTHARAAANRAVRVAWQHDPRSTTASFPHHVCNGKKNRHSVSKRAKSVKGSTNGVAFKKAG